MDSLALLPAAVEGGDWQDIRELVERTGEALRLGGGWLYAMVRRIFTFTIRTR